MRARGRYVLALTVAVAALAGTIAFAVAGGSGRVAMSRTGYSMMGAAGQRSAWYVDGSGPVRDIPAARRQAQRFADRLGLRTGEVMQFANNFYVRLDNASGDPATEVLVDPASGDVKLEYGAAMMWNTRYGMMGGSTRGMMGTGRSGMTGDAGMMGRYGRGMGAAGGSGPVDASGARTAADRWLAAQRSAARTAEPEAFPGYFTMETQLDGKVTGMISVNARSGAVLYHWWHGRFVAAQE